MMCDWDSRSRVCYEEYRGGNGHGNDHGNYCRHDEWKSLTTGRCFKKSGYCSQYNGTNKLVCNSPKDHMRCDWDSRYKECYRER